MGGIEYFWQLSNIPDPKPKSQKKIVHFIRNTANKQKAGNKNAWDIKEWLPQSRRGGNVEVKVI